MKNIVTHNLYESLKSQETVDMIEDNIYIYETSVVKGEAYMYPIKTDCTICCICLHGELKGKIDLQPYHVQAPGFGISSPGQILEMESHSSDFQGIFIYMTSGFTKNLNMLMGHSPTVAVRNQPCMVLGEEELRSLLNYCHMVRKVIKTEDNPNRLKIIIHLTIAYFYGIGYFLHKSISDQYQSKDEIIVERFLQELVQNFKKERKVDFYANRLQLSANYLSHVIKAVTGKTASKWIDDYVALEAKALLKSTNMTIQQIADELSFPTQSFFGKFFKRVVGVAPKHYK